MIDFKSCPFSSPMHQRLCPVALFEFVACFWIYDSRHASRSHNVVTATAYKKNVWIEKRKLFNILPSRKHIEEPVATRSEAVKGEIFFHSDSVDDVSQDDGIIEPGVSLS